MTLTRRQKWRIEKIHSERIARSNRASKNSENINLHSTQQIKGRVITRYAQRQLVESIDGKLYQCTDRRNIGLSVAGDKVVFQKTDNNEGVVTAIQPRTNELKRQKKLIASNIDQLWLVVALEPHYEFELIDRYLIMAENENLPINIIVNKIELAKNPDQTSRDFSIYKNIDYQVHFLSVKEEHNLDSLKSNLSDKTHIFLGQSGVGKSSLINTLIPDLDLRVDEISTKTKLGRHTTTNTTIHHIPSGGDLIDSPGIREFQINELSSKQILNGYREFKSYLGKCRFRNCQHVNEPDCAIRNALDSEKIHPARYQSYINLISE